MVLACTLAVLLAPVMIVVALVIYVQDGAPIFYVSERMKAPEIGFALIKFRTMSQSHTDSGVSGGDKTARVTKMGRFLRSKRLDELPQLWNILRGDMSFVGPRPPLRQYVERFPDLYRDVLTCRPGVTGLATTRFHVREETLLASCRDGQETDAIYARRCVPRKAQLDIIYRNHQSVCFDFVLIMDTLRRVIFRK